MHTMYTYVGIWRHICIHTSTYIILWIYCNELSGKVLAALSWSELTSSLASSMQHPRSPGFRVLGASRFRG